MISHNSILNHELIGSKIEVTESNQKKVTGLSGSIVYETKNIFYVRESSNMNNKKNKSIKKIPKQIIKKMKIYIEKDVCFISGLLTIGRPEDRLYKK